MPRVRHQHTRATDQLGHFPRFAGWTWLVLIATDHQRRRGVQFAQAWQQILSAKGDPPHRHDAFAQAFRRQRGEFGAEVPVQCRLRIDARTEKDRHHDVEQLRRYFAAFLDHLEQRKIVLPGRLRLDADIGVHQHQAVESLRRRQRQPHAPHATDRKPHQREAFYFQMIDQRQRLTGDIIQRPCALRKPPGFTMAPQVQRNHPILLRQRSNLRRPHVLVPQVTAGQQHRRASALINIVKGLSVYGQEGHRMTPLEKMEPEG